MDNQHFKPDPVATKAWAQMRDLLDKEMPVNNGNNGKNKRKYGILLLLLLIGGCGVYKFYNHNNGFILADNKKSSVYEEEKIMNTSPNPGKDEAAKTNGVRTNQSDNSTIENLESRNAGRPVEPTVALKINERQKPSKVEAGKDFHQPISNNVSVTESHTTNKLKTPDVKPIPNNQQENSKTNSLVDGNDMAKNLQNLTTNKQPDQIQNSTTSQANIIVGNKEKIDSTTTTKTPINVVGKAEQQMAKTQSQTKSLKQTSQNVKTMHFGVEWNAPLQFNNKALFIDANAKSQPLTLLIPTLWMSKNISQKSTLLLSLNPYAQYLVNKSSALQSGNYIVNATSASTISQPSLPTYLEQTFSLNKLIGFEVALQYGFHLSKKWTVGVELGNNWTHTALLNEKIVRNGKDIIKDSLYSVIKTDKDWQYIKSSFITGKINIGYNFGRYQLGLSLSKPFTNVYKNETNVGSFPVNMQATFRWIVK